MRGAPRPPSSRGLLRRRSVAAAFTAAAAATAAAALVAGRCVQRVVVLGASMEPVLLDGDRLVVVAGLRLTPGCLVAVSDPRQVERLLVKRVRAVGPDGIDVRGDEPAHSTDSRTFGPVPRHLVRGRVVWRYGPAARAGRLRSHPPAAPRSIEQRCHRADR